LKSFITDRVTGSVHQLLGRPIDVPQRPQVALLIGLGVGRAQIAKRSAVRTVVETIAIGFSAAVAGVAISVLVDQ
jgi:hypothetical protein